MVRRSPLHDSDLISEIPLSPRQAQQRSLSPSTIWKSRSVANLKFLARQKQRAQTQLHLDAAIVQDERGWVALWTRER